MDTGRAFMTRTDSTTGLHPAPHATRPDFATTVSPSLCIRHHHDSWPDTMIRFQTASSGEQQEQTRQQEVFCSLLPAALVVSSQLLHDFTMSPLSTCLH
ncbi:hypothetical protein [Photobacterium halotolerans]|uniref:Uncharacterized protein n=1 Tax=Photobacterium halotolerans TaxID=265726 RepID=A0A7X4WAS0_9GAMM|nr:hypothetical protein [Photobacterium halotolerans]NAW65279.1 hypothetical protein [Photobacterium halotolerans]